nr:MAG TPA: hypothetical protein [Caudoviricetes sp.]
MVRPSKTAKTCKAVPAGLIDLLMSGKVVADRTFDGETVEDSEDM